MALTEHTVGERGTVLLFHRGANTSPAGEFLKGLQAPDRRKFESSFGAVSEVGAEYRNRERFTRLRDSGSPLWEFKEHEHRLYCIRRQVRDHVYVVLLDSGKKAKTGKSRLESRAIEHAQTLRQEAECDLENWLRENGR
jgi:hypothetical protein